MQQEYSFTLTAPLTEIDRVEELLKAAKKDSPGMRISRKPDRGGAVRFYLSFPFSASRRDLAFQEWFAEHGDAGWELFGPTYGRWGLC